MVVCPKKRWTRRQAASRTDRCRSPTLAIGRPRSSTHHTCISLRIEALRRNGQSHVIVGASGRCCVQRRGSKSIPKKLDNSPRPARIRQQIHAICKKATVEMGRWIQVTTRSQPDFPQEKLENSAHAHRAGFKAEGLSGDQPNQALLFLAMHKQKIDGNVDLRSRLYASFRLHLLSFLSTLTSDRSFLFLRFYEYPSDLPISFTRLFIRNSPENLTSSAHPVRHFRRCRRASMQES